jgi:hypothetical protein
MGASGVPRSEPVGRYEIPCSGVRDDLQDRATQCSQCAALRFIDIPQVLVNFLGRHRPTVYEPLPYGVRRQLIDALAPSAT